MESDELDRKSGLKLKGKVITVPKSELQSLLALKKMEKGEGMSHSILINWNKLLNVLSCY